MFQAALGRVSKDGNREGEHEEEVWDEAPAEVGGELNPVIEENVGRNAAEFEEPVPNDSSLGRILNPIHFGVDNQDDDVNSRHPKL
jgi:hypothetical protein